LYDASLDKLLSLKNNDINLIFDEIHHKILERFGSESVEYSVIISHYVGKDQVTEVVWNFLVSQDENSTSSLLLDNFIYGTVVSLPANKLQDRYVLILVKRN